MEETPIFYTFPISLKGSDNKLSTFLLRVKFCHFIIQKNDDQSAPKIERHIVPYFKYCSELWNIDVHLADWHVHVLYLWKDINNYNTKIPNWILYQKTSLWNYFIQFHKLFHNLCPLLSQLFHYIRITTIWRLGFWKLNTLKKHTHQIVRI